jgi:hypothetical protein
LEQPSLALEVEQRAHKNKKAMGARILSRVGCQGSAVLLAIIVSAAGCGGGSSGASAPPPASSAPPPAPPSPPPTPPPSPVAATIASHPRDATIAVGSSVTFAVTAAGSEPFTYQWRRNGAPIVGAVENTYAMSFVGLHESGAQFSVAVTNAGGQAESNAAVLTVLERVSITAHPQPQRVYVGEKATYAVAAEGSAPLSYQWRRNGVAIPGASEVSYEIGAAQAADAEAMFDVIVSNPVHSDQSGEARLIVEPLPPRAVGVEPMSFLVALGYASRQTGEQRRPGPAASATVTLDPELPWLNPHSREPSPPFWYEATWAADNLDHSQFYSPLAASTRPLPLSRRDSGTLAGVELDRYRGLSVVDGSSVAMDLLIGIRSGFNEVGIGNWKFIGAEQLGFFAGYPSARGSFIAGEPTADSELAALESAQYRGFTHGGLELELLYQDSFWEFSGRATAAYDAATRELTLSLQDLELHDSSMSTNFPTSWPQPMADDPTILSSTTLSCTAVVDVVTNAFSCTLSDQGGLSGSFSGKFYGPAGRELAGAFSIVGLIRSSFDDGMVGAVAMKR